MLKRPIIAKIKVLKGIFLFNGKYYDYFNHPFNMTSTNERCIEIPIIMDYIKQNKDKNILEVGNVLLNYFDVKHDIVDKYEKSEGVMSKDIVHYCPVRKYDLIISISTLEHIVWGPEEKKELDKCLYALENMIELLKSGGKLIVTFPLGYNTNLDSLLKTNIIKFDEIYCLHKNKETEEWTQENWDEVKYKDHSHYMMRIVDVDNIIWDVSRSTYLIIGIIKKEVMLQ